MARTLIRAAAGLFVVFSFAISCNDDEPEPVASISDFSPKSGFAGSSVVISGQGFSETLAENIVKFNGTPAEVTNAGRTQLTVTVPANATSGKVSVTVNGHTATSEDDFTVLTTNVSEFAPVSGVVGTKVVINGENFSSQADNMVKFNGVDAFVLKASTTQITTMVPKDATTGKITVISAGRTVTTTADFTVLKTVITGFSPASALVGSNIVITGENFVPDAEDFLVTIDNAVAPVVEASATQLTVTVPQEANKGKIAVTIHGVTTVSADDFTVLVPVVTDFVPASAPVGSQVTIHGQYFSANVEGNDVMFGGGGHATVVSATETELVVVVPFDAYAGSVSVTAHGKTGASSTRFELPSITVTDIAPDVGTSGTEVVISGSGFSPVADFNIVTFDGIAAEVISVSDDALHVIVPDGVTEGEMRFTAGAYGPTLVSSGAFQMCNDHPELILREADLGDIADDGSSFVLHVAIENVGGTAASFADVKAGVTLSEDGSSGPDDIIVDQGFSLAQAGTLDPGESFVTDLGYILDPGGNLVDDPYVHFHFYTVYNTLDECDIGNNGVVIHVE